MPLSELRRGSRRSERLHDVTDDLLMGIGADDLACSMALAKRASPPRGSARSGVGMEEGAQRRENSAEPVCAS